MLGTIVGTIVGLAIGSVAAVAYRRRTRWRVGGAEGPFGVIFLLAAALAGAYLALVVIITVGLTVGLFLWTVLNFLGVPNLVTQVMGLPVGLALGVVIGAIIRISSRDDYGLP